MYLVYIGIFLEPFGSSSTSGYGSSRSRFVTSLHLAAIILETGGGSLLTAPRDPPLTRPKGRNCSVREDL